MHGVRPSGGPGSIDPQLRMGVGDFDTKVAIIVRDDLASWQRLNVTPFLISGVVGGAGEVVVGEPYAGFATALLNSNDVDLVSLGDLSQPSVSGNA